VSARLAPCLMVQGTASSVGKSLVVAAWCRHFARAGLRVAPFKSQNMALNSAVTADGLEIGRAQAVQAEAAWLEPTVDMNPILLKPEGDRRSQVVVMGKPIGSLSALEYHAYKPELEGIIAQSLARLRAEHDLVVIEGAGSPAEINLKARDIVNMHVARVADAPVLLVGDIDRGGVFAAFVGTLALLEPDERARVAAFVINKFRGDLALLEPGLVQLRQLTGKPVLGVLPYLQRLRVADEDSLSLDRRLGLARAQQGELDIVVVRLPRISNHDDVEAIEHEPGVVVRFAERADEVRGADLVIVPGSKSTIADLAWLRATGIADVVLERARQGAPVLGICGGCQMLGLEILDPERVESSEERVPGLGLLSIRTRFAGTKRTARVRCLPRTPSFLSVALDAAAELDGYEIHMGRLEPAGEGAAAAFEIRARNGRAESATDGAVGAGGAVVGTMIHGLFENDAARASLLGELRRLKGLSSRPSGSVPSRQAEYDRLEAAIRDHLDRDMLWRLAGQIPA
jgi:adenosylcobyric acid synthase